MIDPDSRAALCLRPDDVLGVAVMVRFSLAPFPGRRTHAVPEARKYGSIMTADVDSVRSVSLGVVL
jgi:hypothetical protein